MTKKALIMVDLQNDFMPGGSLGVPEGDQIISGVNEIQKKFDIVIATQDWHPVHHNSFHKVWPIHCVQHTFGSELVKALDKNKITKIIYKGVNPHIDSYSIFFDNERQQKTELDAYLKHHQINILYILGLASEYCVKFSVLDALNLNYKVYVVQDLCRGINLKPKDAEEAFSEMKNQGAVMINAYDNIF